MWDGIIPRPQEGHWEMVFFSPKASSCIFVHPPVWSTRNLFFAHISTVHEGAFVLMASEIILTPDSPM